VWVGTFNQNSAKYVLKWGIYGGKTYEFYVW
jgi:hypothetical protein